MSITRVSLPRSILLAPLMLAVVAGGCCKKSSSEQKKPAVTPRKDLPVATSTLQVKPTPVLAPGAVPEQKAQQPLNHIPEIPSGRSAPPTVSEWSTAPQINTQGPNSHPANCFMKIKREWLKVHCEGPVTRIAKMSKTFGNEGSDYFKFVKPGKTADVVVRLSRGKALKMRIVREGMPTASLFVNWPTTSSKPTIIALGKYFGDPDAPI